MHAFNNSIPDICFATSKNCNLKFDCGAADLNTKLRKILNGEIFIVANIISIPQFLSVPIILSTPCTCRWEDNNKINLIELGYEGEDWRYLV
jgi:hypothetical protein